jgi:hypothetical protein
VIPPFSAAGTLPPGIHEADDWSEVIRRFGGTARRAELLAMLRLGLDNLRSAGCPWVLLDGSFVTDKAEPNDVDGCWQLEPTMDLARLDSCFLLRRPFADKRLQKDLYGMDFYRANQVEAASGKPFPAFFQTDRQGDARGIVRLVLAESSGASATGNTGARA